MKGPIFDSAAECLETLERRVRYSNPVDSSREADRRMARGDRQTRCGSCGRWKWDNERCNHFTASAGSET